jgi:hypothetical protein
LKTENCKVFFSFQAGNNYQKLKIKIKIKICGEALSAGKGGGEGGRERGGEGRGGRCVRVDAHVRADALLRPCGRWGASARTRFCVRADASVRADARMRARGCKCFIPRLLHNGRYSASKSRAAQRPLSDRPSIHPSVRPLSSA